MILPRGLKAAAGPNPNPKGDDCEPDVELISILAVPEVNRVFWISSFRLSLRSTGIPFTYYWNILRK